MRRQARRVVRAGGLALVTATLVPPYLALRARAPEDERGAIRDAWVRRWADALLALFAIASTCACTKRRAIVIRAAAASSSRTIAARSTWRSSSARSAGGW